MDNKIIFPAEVVSFTAEYHFNQHNNRSKIIYILTISCLVLSFIALSFIKVHVSVQGRGLLTPANERNIIKAPISGRIDMLYFKLNQPIQVGDILLTICTDVIDGQSEYLAKKETDIRLRIHDLTRLVQQKNGTKTSLSLKTPVYQQEQNLYLQQLTEADLQLENATIAFNRNKKLYDKRVLSEAEFEKFNYEQRAANNKKNLIQKQQISQWENTLVNLRTELADIISQQNKISKEKEFYTIKAPINGSILQYNGLMPGNFVALGETIAEISPDSGLIATVQISPKDIGLIRQGQSVRFQIDAFNYNEWGVVHGEVYDISKDVYIDDNQSPYFLVKCSLNEKSLQLKNGYIGTLKKGLSFQARFQVAKRTLFQLLYDQVDDWLDPHGNQPT